LVSFYCLQCQIIHEDYPISDIMFISESFEMCKESYENILKIYLKGE